MSRSLVISDISVSTNENSIKHELVKKYDGVESVTRWYFDSDENQPMSCVQVDFNSHENMEKVLANGTVVIAGICRRVSPLKGPQCYRCQAVGHKTHECHMKPLKERDLINIFEQQKQYVFVFRI
jgi:hypothetical protein